MVQTTTDPGTISVPMSSILDALEGVLTEDERTALFEQLIGLRPAGVAPGDLITAELFNQVLSDINDLMERVAVLEGAAGGPIIDHIEPGGDLPAASKITIVGSNFRPDDLDTFVSFGNVNISDFFPESDQFHIMVPVPVSLQGLPADLPVSVTCNGKTSNKVTAHFVPQVIIPSGVAQITYQGAPLGQIVKNTLYTLTWRVLSQVNVAQSFDLTPTIAVKGGAANEAAWLANIHLSVNGPITLQPGQFQDITMSVTTPDDPAAAADIGLHADSTTTSIEGQGPPLSLAVGDTTEVSDPRALVKSAVFVATADLSKFSVPGEPAGFRVKPSKTNLPLPMEIDTNGQGGGFYAFEATVEPGTPQGGGGPQTGRWTIGAFPPGRTQLGPSVTSQFEVPVTSSATVDTATVSHITIKAKCYAAANGGSPVFTSFVRVPITGKS